MKRRTHRQSTATPKRTGRFAKSAAVVAAAALALAACSPASKEGEDTETTSASQTVVTFRLWDDVAAPAYEASFAEFTKANPDIKVKVEVVPWAAYWEQLPLDISSGQMADIYWTNSSNFALYADNGNLMDITETLGTGHDAWQQSVVDLYTRNGKLWGVPQLWDSIALFYNKDLVEAAGVDASKLTWAPGAGEADTLLPALQKLTVDKDGKNAADPAFNAANTKVFGFNAQADLQAIYVDFLAQNGATLQGEDDQFNFATPKGEESFQYLVDLINKYKVAPPAAETNINGDLSRDLFLRGELALFQSGPYSLKTIADNASVNWGLVPMVAGPEGRIGVVHGVVAVGNAQTKHRDATVKVLEWLGSAKGQMPLAEQGVSFPGAVEAQEAFINYWAKKGVDVSVFIEAASGITAPAPRGPAVNAGANAYTTILLDVFLGSVTVKEGLAKAQTAGNEAMKQ